MMNLQRYRLWYQIYFLPCLEQGFWHRRRRRRHRSLQLQVTLQLSVAVARWMVLRRYEADGSGWIQEPACDAGCGIPKITS